MSSCSSWASQHTSQPGNTPKHSAAQTVSLAHLLSLCSPPNSQPIINSTPFKLSSIPNRACKKPMKKSGSSQSKDGLKQMRNVALLLVACGHGVVILTLLLSRRSG